MKVALIGAGWYGCHIASYMKHLGFSVTIFERDDEIFMGASGSNQNRLHLGFHYARDYETRMQSRDGYNRFLERYGRFTLEVARNYYAVPEGRSLIDFRTYKAIMASSGIEFEEIPLSSIDLDLRSIAGVINTHERVIDEKAARAFFKQELGAELRLNAPLRSEDVIVKYDCVDIKGEQFDYLIDTTWSKVFSYNESIFYEPTLLLYYESDVSPFALTLVDGPLASIYPTSDDGVYTLSSVTHTPLGRYKSISEAEARLRAITERELDEKRAIMEEEIEKYYPKFSEQFRHSGPQLSMKTKPEGLEENRACYVTNEGRLFKVMSGKIDTIFVAAERVVSTISYLE